MWSFGGWLVSLVSCPRPLVVGALGAEAESTGDARRGCVQGVSSSLLGRPSAGGVIAHPGRPKNKFAESRAFHEATSIPGVVGGSEARAKITLVNVLQGPTQVFKQR